MYHRLARRQMMDYWPILCLSSSKLVLPRFCCSILDKIGVNGTKVPQVEAAILNSFGGVRGCATCWKVPKCHTSDIFNAFLAANWCYIGFFAAYWQKLVLLEPMNGFTFLCVLLRRPIYGFTSKYKTVLIVTFALLLWSKTGSKSKVKVKLK